MLTPFTENGDVDYGKFVRNVQKWNEDQLCGYLVLGSNSETAYLTESEKMELMRLTKENAKPGRILLAGTGSDCEQDTIRLTNEAAKMGYDAALVLTPCYYDGQMNAKALIRFFTHVADAADMPIMIYNVPKFTHVNITAEAVSALCRHPNIIGMKDSTGDVPQMATWKRIVPEDFNLMVGTASAWYPALTLGVQAAILALANTNPNECAAVQEAFDAGDWQKARALYQRVFPINTAITATYGIPGLKYAADLMGYEGGFVRSPLGELDEGAKVKIKEIIDKAMA
jgi:4-hydroxy-2-oxoglutarate aldolase